MQGPMAAPVLVEVTRGPAVESSHRGQVAVADAQGNLRSRVGDPEALVRPALPGQALPGPGSVGERRRRGPGLAAPELALFSGSLSGQDFQTEPVTATRPAWACPPRPGSAASTCRCTGPPPRPWPRLAGLPLRCTIPVPASTRPC